MAELIAFLQLHGSDILSALTSLITAASIIANFTKTDEDNKAVGVVSKIVNLLAVNIKAGAIAPK